MTSADPGQTTGRLIDDHYLRIVHAASDSSIVISEDGSRNDDPVIKENQIAALSLAFSSPDVGTKKAFYQFFMDQGDIGESVYLMQLSGSNNPKQLFSEYSQVLRFTTFDEALSQQQARLRIMGKYMNLRFAVDGSRFSDPVSIYHEGKDIGKMVTFPYGFGFHINPVDLSLPSYAGVYGVLTSPTDAHSLPVQNLEYTLHNQNGMLSGMGVFGHDGISSEPFGFGLKIDVGIGAQDEPVRVSGISGYFFVAPDGSDFDIAADIGSPVSIQSSARGQAGFPFEIHFDRTSNINIHEGLLVGRFYGLDLDSIGAIYRFVDSARTSYWGVLSLIRTTEIAGRTGGTER